jgi:hypothetical protein
MFRWEFRVPPGPDHMLMRHIPASADVVGVSLLPWWQPVGGTMALAVGPQQSPPIPPPPLPMRPFTPVAPPELPPAPAGWAAGSENSRTTLGASDAGSDSDAGAACK